MTLGPINTLSEIVTFPAAFIIQPLLIDTLLPIYNLEGLSI